MVQGAVIASHTPCTTDTASDLAAAGLALTRQRGSFTELPAAFYLFPIKQVPVVALCCCIHAQLHSLIFTVSAVSYIVLATLASSCKAHPISLDSLSTVSIVLVAPGQGSFFLFLGRVLLLTPANEAAPAKVLCVHSTGRGQTWGEGLCGLKAQDYRRLDRASVAANEHDARPALTAP